MHHLFSFFYLPWASICVILRISYLAFAYNTDFNKFPNVFFNKKPLPLKNPKILWVTFDPTLCFAAHCKRPADKARHSIGVMKELAGSSSVQSKETLILTYKALIRFYLDWASPAWAHAASKTSTDYLQVTQNQALHVIIDSTLMSSTSKTSIDYLQVTQNQALHVIIDSSLMRSWKSRATTFNISVFLSPHTVCITHINFITLIPHHVKLDNPFY